MSSPKRAQPALPWCLFALVLACGGSVAVPAALPAQEAIAVSGEIVDLTCYLSEGRKGRRHRACAQACAKKGLPIGILSETGGLYLLIEDHDNPEPYEVAKKLAGDKAEISGKTYSKDGMASIMVREAKER